MTWFNTIENRLREEKGNPAEYVILASGYLRKAANQTYQTLRMGNQVQTWQEFKETFVKIYQPYDKEREKAKELDRL